MRTRLFAFLLAAQLALAAAHAAAPFDITFYTTGDPHLKAFDTDGEKGGETNNPRVRANLGRMKQIAGSALPGGGGKAGKPLGLIVAGDLCDGGREKDPASGSSYDPSKAMVKAWENFTASFGLDGTQAGALVDFPIYEGYGNHDQNGFWPGITEKIAERNAKRPNVTALSGSFTYPSGGYKGTISKVHYAWKWGPIHFVQANMRVGDSPARYPCAGSLTFLKDYLEKNVGKSGEPVFIIHHLPPASPANDWPVADQREYYNLIKDYNIAGLIVAHTHSFGDYTWSGPDNGPKAIQVYQADSLTHSGANTGYCTVFRIFSKPGDPSKATLVAAQRKVDGNWGASFERTIALPAGGAGAGGGR